MIQTKTKTKQMNKTTKKSPNSPVGLLPVKKKAFIPICNVNYDLKYILYQDMNKKISNEAIKE